MSKTLTLNLPDDLYEAVRVNAEASGQAPADWVATSLRQCLPAPAEPEPLRQLRAEIDQLLKNMADKQGISHDEMRARWRAKYGPKPRPHLTKEEWESADQRLIRHLGAYRSGDPNGADNERIDADLAREYGSTHEDGT